MSISLPDYLDRDWRDNPDVGEWRKVHLSEAFPWPRRPLAELKAFVADALAAGKAHVVLPEGVFESCEELPRNQAAHWCLRGLQGVTLEGKGTVILCRTPDCAISIDSCQDLTLREITVDYDPLTGLPFSQATCTAADPDGAWTDVEVHDGYHLPGPDVSQLRKVSVFDPRTLLLKPDTWTGYNREVQHLGGRSLRIIDSSARAEVGEYVTLVYRQGRPHGININDCRGIRIESVTIHSNPMFAILDSDSANSVFCNVRITPGPIPDGASVPRLMSSGQDGIHLKDLHGGNTCVDSCLIEAHTDDGIAATSSYFLVVERKGKELRVAAKFGSVALSPGDKLKHTHHCNMKCEHLVSTVESVHHIKEGKEAERLAAILDSLPLSKFLRDKALAGCPFWGLTLDTDKGTDEAGDLLSRADYNKGLLVKNNTVRNHRARGMVIKTSDCTIRGNTVVHSQAGGIVCVPEADWLEGSCCTNLTIEDNRIMHVNHGRQGADNCRAGAITVACRGLDGFSPSVGCHQGLTIKGNRFEDVWGLPLMLSSATDVTLADNLLERSHHHHRTTGTKLGVDDRVGGWFCLVDGLRSSGNVVRDPGHHFKKAVTMRDTELLTGEGFSVEYTNSKTRP